jgi:hypothetical protein
MKTRITLALSGAVTLLTATLGAPTALAATTDSTVTVAPTQDEQCSGLVDRPSGRDAKGVPSRMIL